ncbi:MAG: MFS transporter, partial [Streptosporangiaceae bacterium]
MSQAALAPREPYRRVGVRFTGSLSLGMLGLWAGFFAPLQVLLPEQIASVTPASKVTHLALVTTAGAAVALVANPLGGALSDRTTSRFGRRRPWVVGA